MPGKRRLLASGGPLLCERKGVRVRVGFVVLSSRVFGSILKGELLEGPPNTPPPRVVRVINFL